MTAQRGFSLVEMIVVVAIIMLLAALLFPVLETALGSAERTSCISNLHHLSVATSLYSDDYDGWGRSYTGIEDLSFEVEEGQIFGLVGPNGSGKTTTLKLLLGLIFPTSGTGQVFGAPLGSPQSKERVGYLPEGPYFYEHLNAPELLRMYGSLFGLGGKQFEGRIQELLELVDMWDRRDYRVGNYSRGMRQRIGVAQALINNPDLLFFDEPTSGLDPIGAKDMREIILRLRADGKTIFLCSHLLKEMEPICDNIAILSRGHLVGEGAVQDLLAGEEQHYRLELREPDEAMLAKIGTKSSETVWLDEVARLKYASRQDAFEAAALAEDAGAFVLAVGPDRRTLEEVFIDTVGEVAPDASDL